MLNFEVRTFLQQTTKIIENIKNKQTIAKEEKGAEKTITNKNVTVL